jgi:isopentenyl-diphosphate Delta-isomerase
MDERVILVDLNDNVLGTMDKMEAHVQGKLHRAFSVFIFNTDGELLLQQRALDKYHSGGKWTNTCCSHPRLGELNEAAAQRRLMEEMGMSCELTYAFNFTYRAAFEDGIEEYEFDHVYYGISDEIPDINTLEVADFRYADVSDLKNDITANPNHYTEWFKICYDKVLDLHAKLF